MPQEKDCHTVLVQDGYVVVKIDHVHQNAESVALDILMIDAEIFTLGMHITPGSNRRKLLFASRPLVSLLHRLQDDPQLLVKKSGHAPPTLEHVKKDVTAGSPPKKKRRTTPKKSEGVRQNPRNQQRKQRKQRVRQHPMN